MVVWDKAKKYCTDPAYRFGVNNSFGFYAFLPDEKFLKKCYRSVFSRECNLETPETFTEKLQWLKLYDRNPLYSLMVDKFSAKKYVQSIIGSEYIIPTLQVCDTVEDIDFSALPKKFVIKCTHNSGLGMCICEDKSKLDVDQVKRELKRGLKQNYYITKREWPYKNVKPRVIVEQYLHDDNDGELRDYKFFCFNGQPKILYITQGRNTHGSTTADFYDMDFNHLELKMDHDNAALPPHKPINFELMKELAAKLAQGIPQVRVDFYEVNGKVYFGELTFFHCSGFQPIYPDTWDKIMGSWITLPDKRRIQSV